MIYSNIGKDFETHIMHQIVALSSSSCRVTVMKLQRALTSYLVLIIHACMWAYIMHTFMQLKLNFCVTVLILICTMYVLTLGIIAFAL